MCESPSGDNGARTGLVVGSLLSSVVVLLIWIILVILWSRGVKDKYVTLCVYMHMYMYMFYESLVCLHLSKLFL